MKAQLNIITALTCEARLFIDCFSLKGHNTSSQFRLYQNQTKDIHLIVCGVGKLKAAAAVSFLYAYTGCNKNAYFLNVGIAGSQRYALNELCAINKIADQSTNKHYYPLPLVYPNKMQQTQLLTTEQASETYPDNGLVDMEASGFIDAALAFVNKEQIACLKVVSDSSVQDQPLLTPKLVTQLLSYHKDSLVSFCKHLLMLSGKLSARHQNPQYYDEMLQNWHFSAYQSAQLQELLRRWQIILADSNPMVQCQTFNTAKSVLLKLSETLEMASY